MNQNHDDDTRRFAQVERLRTDSAMRMLNSAHGAQREFASVAMLIARADNDSHLRTMIESSWGSSGLPGAFNKALVAGQSLDTAWGTAPGRDMATSYLRSIADGSIMDALLRYATPIPPNLNHLLVASGAVGNVVAEGDPKAVTRVTLSPDAIERIKCAALLVFTEELAKMVGPAAEALLEQELRTALLSAFNIGILDALPKVAIAGTGTALGDLNAGLAAAGTSDGYVVAARREVVRELAMQAEGRMAIAGGEYIPGVHIVPVDQDSGGPEMTIIPASRMALTDYGLIIRSARHASVQMSDTPISPGTMVSLYQTNSRALLCERSFQIVAPVPAVEVG